MTPWDYFAKDPVGGADFLEIARRGTGELIFCTWDAIVMREPSSGVVLFHAKNEPAARAALEKTPRSKLYAVHGEQNARMVMDAMRIKSVDGLEKCHQARYMKPEAPVPVSGVELRVLDEAYVDTVARHYGGVDDPAYVRQRVEAGVVVGAFVDGALAGFIGTHNEGSMGMLEIFPEYRRRGLGYALEAGLIRRFLEQGMIPFCQVVDGNEASMRLQEKLGMTFSDEPVYWMAEG